MANTYEKTFQVSSPYGEKTNYLFELRVGESSGSSDYDIHCEGHCRSTFGDLRFYDADGKPLLYYLRTTTLTGTTPNKTITAIIVMDIGTSATTFIMQYGDAAGVTSGSYADAITAYIQEDRFERGSNGSALGGDWTDTAGTVRISTEKKKEGTRSFMVYANSALSKASFPITGGLTNKRYRFWAYKDASAEVIFGVGDGTKRAWLKWDAGDDVCIYGSGDEYGASIAAPANSVWHLFEMRNFNWTAGTWDLYINKSKVGDGLTMGSGSDPVYNNKFRVEQASHVTTYLDTWIDELMILEDPAQYPALGTISSEDSASELPSPFSPFQYFRINITSGWDASLCSMGRFDFKDAGGTRINQTTMTHSAKNTLNGAVVNCSDGNAATYWQYYVVNNPNWWKVNLGKRYEVPALYTAPDSSKSRNMKGFSVEASNDDMTWVEVLGATQTTSSTSTHTWDLAMPEEPGLPVGAGPTGVKTWNDIPSANIKTWNDIPWNTIKAMN